MIHHFPLRPPRWLPAQRLNSALLLGCLVLSAPFARGQAPAPVPADPAKDTAAFSGKVVETTNAAGYTYVLVDTGTAKLWAAAPQFPVKVGDALAVAEGMPMRNYHSKSLNRDFALVAFTGNVKVNGVSPGANDPSPALPQGHPPIAGGEARPAVGEAKPIMDLASIKKAAGGKRIAELYANKAKLRGQQVKVRGRVVKYNGDILGKNWLHIQDGSGSAGSNDLTVTTLSKAKIGDIVLVAGAVATDRDFGGGYQYSLILEDAEVTVE
jgi:hypothetical protein